MSLAIFQTVLFSYEIRIQVIIIYLLYATAYCLGLTILNDSSCNDRCTMS